MKTTKSTALSLSMLFAATLSLLGTMPAFAETPTAPTTSIQAPNAQAPETTDDASRYAAREAKAITQAEYQGGGTVAIGVTVTSTAILLIVLLLILL